MTFRRLLALVFIAGLAYGPTLSARADDAATAPIAGEAVAVVEPTPTTPAPEVASPTPLASAEPVTSAAPVASPVPDASVLPAASEAPATPEPPPARERDQAGYSYNYALQDTRYNDLIVSIDAYKPFGSPKARIRPFIDGALVRDSRTSPGSARGGGPPTPLVLSDNYGLVSAGLQYTNQSGLRLFAQGGKSFTVGPIAAQPSGGDVRAGAQLYREWGPTAQRNRDYGNFYGSATYYSRYSDSVTYLQAETARNIGTFAHPIEPFARGVLTLDTRRFYYSNLIELTVGVRVHPLGTRGPILAIEAVKGAYIKRTPLPLGVTSTYSDFRPTFSIGFSL